MSADTTGRTVARVVRGRIGYELIDPATQTPAVTGRTIELTWTSTDPDAVTLVFHAGARRSATGSPTPGWCGGARS